MKFLLLCWRDLDNPLGGGSERYLQRVAEYLADHGHQVVYRTAMYPGAARRERLRTAHGSVEFSRGGNEYTVFPRTLAAILAARLHLPFGGLRGWGQFDAVVDTQNGIPFCATLVSGAPTVLLTHHCHREHWLDFGGVLGHVGWFIERRLSPIIHRRTHYVTVSRPSADELVELGVQRARIDIVRNGVDKPPADLVQLAQQRDRSGIATDGPRLITLSRLTPHKQIEHAIDVVEKLRHEYPSIHLDIVGSGWWEDRLRERVATHLVEDYVTFHGHVTERRKQELLAQADIHLVPSLKEGWGIVVIEAAEYGVPTIGYNSSQGLKDSIISGHTGVLVDSVDDMAQAVRTLVSDPARLARMGEAAQRRAATFSWRATGREFEHLLLRDIGVPLDSGTDAATVNRFAPPRQSIGMLHDIMVEALVKELTAVHAHNMERLRAVPVLERVRRRLRRVGRRILWRAQSLDLSLPWLYSFDDALVRDPKRKALERRRRNHEVM